MEQLSYKDANGHEIVAYDESHALLIGVSGYSNGWPKLPGVEQDIKEVCPILEKHEFETVLVENPDGRGLRDAFDEFIYKYGLKPNNRLLFYFSGHGHTLEQSFGGEMGYIVPTDAPNPKIDSDGFRAKALPMQMIEVYAKQIQSKHAIFLFDSCFSGSLFEIRGAVPESISYITANPVRQFITSGSAYETVPDRSIFRELFVSALKGEVELNKDGYVTGTNLGVFLQNNVINYTNGAQHPQYGKIRDPKLDKGDFLFTLHETGGKPSDIQLIEPPKKKSFSLGELEDQAEKIESNKADWNKVMQEMRQAYNRVLEFEKRNVYAGLKIEAWNKFLDHYGEKNPHSEEDEYLRQSAREQIEHWNTENARQTEKALQKGRLVGMKPPLKEVTSGKTYIDSVAGMEFILAEGGCYQMGDTFGDGYDNEKPVHEVCVESFYIGKYVVTQGQWVKIMGSNPSHFKNGDDYPVERVSWDDAQAFLKKLNDKVGGNYRLPTEAEWEYAARSGGKRERYSGTSGKIDEYAWYNSNSGRKTYPVGQKKPNGLGLYDMTGNVLEWVQDWYGENYYTERPKNNPKGPSSGQIRVLRGGSWNLIPVYLRASIRSWNVPSKRLYIVGFRVAFSAK